MTLYAAIFFIHFLAVAVLFVAFGIELAANSFLRRSTTADEAKTWLRLARLAPLLNGPALGVLILSGVYLAYLISSMNQGWISASFLGIGVVVFLGVLVNVPRMTRIRKSLAADTASCSAETVARLRDPLLATAIRIRTLTAIAILFLMTAKLPLGLSVRTLAASVILGAAFSVPLWTRR